MAIHGGDIYGTDIQKTVEEGKEILDFSANINPLGMPESVRQAVMTQSVRRQNTTRTPECRKLKQALARRHGIKRESLICGNGGAELIYRLAYALRPKESTSDSPYLCRI